MWQDIRDGTHWDDPLQGRVGGIEFGEHQLHLGNEGCNNDTWQAVCCVLSAFGW
jgi:hypothetical protein